MKKIILSISLFSFIFININNASAKVTNTNKVNQNNNYAQNVSQNISIVSGPEINNLPLCDSTYKLNCPYNVRCRNINGMIAFTCPAAYTNQPLNNNFNTNYTNNYVNNNSNTNYNYSNTNYFNNNNVEYNVKTNYNFVNSPVYFENGAYYTNPVIRPYYDLVTTNNNYYTN